MLQALHNPCQDWSIPEVHMPSCFSLPLSKDEARIDSVEYVDYSYDLSAKLLRIEVQRHESKADPGCQALQNESLGGSGK